MFKEILVNALTAVDDARPRSQQTAIGVSSLGDCKRKVWHMIQGTEPTNPNVRRLPAILGTAIHDYIERAIDNPDRFLLEHRVEIDGFPPATIDLFDKETGTVVDWKTIKLKDVDYFPNTQKRWQVQTYAHLMALAGYKVNSVVLIGIPRDGTEDDIVEHVEPYDPTIAAQALGWLDQLQHEEYEPPAERDAVSFCQKYCQFYGKCEGITAGDVKAGAPLTDSVASDAALAYREVLAAEKELATKKAALRSTLEGFSGTTFDGVTVSWVEQAGSKTIDAVKVKELLGDDTPYKQGAPITKLTVK